MVGFAAAGTVGGSGCSRLSRVAIVALPWLLGLPAVQRRLAAEANKILAPGSVEFGAIRLSWFRPDARSPTSCCTTPRETVWSLPRRPRSAGTSGKSLITRPRSVTLTIARGDLDIERLADGTVDLYETLKPVISEHPPIRLVIRIDNGRLRFRDPIFTDPVVADNANIVLDLGRNSEPIAWNLQLAQTRTNGGPSRIDDRGELQPRRRRSVWPARPDASRSTDAVAVDARQSSRPGAGRADRQARRRACDGRVQIDGDATITNLVAIGDPFPPTRFTSTRCGPPGARGEGRLLDDRQARRE